MARIEPKHVQSAFDSERNVLFVLTCGWNRRSNWSQCIHGRVGLTSSSEEERRRSSIKITIGCAIRAHRQPEEWILIHLNRVVVVLGWKFQELSLNSHSESGGGEWNKLHLLVWISFCDFLNRDLKELAGGISLLIKVIFVYYITGPPRPESSSISHGVLPVGKTVAKRIPTASGVGLV